MPSGVYIRTEQNKINIGKAKLGQIPWNKNKKGVQIMSKETRKKMSLAGIGKPKSENHKKKLSESKLGNKNPMKKRENAIKVSQALKGKYFGGGWKKGHIPWNVGTIGKIKAWNKGIIGENSHSWQGGKSFEPYSPDWIDILKESIRARDNYICQECGIHQDELEGYHKHLDIHHIDYDKKNCDPKNLITLCKSCHTKTNFNRGHWFKYYSEREIEQAKAI